MNTQVLKLHNQSSEHKSKKQKGIPLIPHIHIMSF